MGGGGVVSCRLLGDNGGTTVSIIGQKASGRLTIYAKALKPQRPCPLEAKAQIPKAPQPNP